MIRHRPVLLPFVCIVPLLLIAPAVHPDELHGQNVTVAKKGPDLFDVTFRLAPEGDVQSVSVVGSFNDWEPAAQPMEIAPGEEGARRVFQRTIPLRSGKHLYKFVVDRSTWIPDPANSLREPDGFGGENSILRLGALARIQESRAKRGDGRISADGFLHDPQLPMYFVPVSTNEVRLRVLTQANDAEKLELLRPTAGDLTWGNYPMSLSYSDGRLDYYEVDLRVKKGEELTYAFAASDGGVRFMLDAAGVRERAEKPLEAFRQTVREEMVFLTPDWAKKVIWYQILPDRFRNGNTANDPPNTQKWTKAWKSPAPWEGKDGQTFYQSYAFERFCGGDLQGIVNRLDYLQELGVSGLYLQPVFQSQSFHGYDVMDYRHVSDRLGFPDEWESSVETEDLTESATWRINESDRLLLRLIEEAHRREMRVMLDVPFNHSGNEHLAFRDVSENGQDSEYADWYEILSWDPFEYQGWGGFGKLPEFAEDADGFESDELERHLFDVTRRWMDPNGDGNPADGVDGWRLDASDDVSAPFWGRWRDHVKSINPDALIIGEWWSRPDAMLGNEGFDGVTNYQLSIALSDFIVNAGTARGIKPSEFDRRLAELRFAYPRQSHLVMVNGLDSHDTDRALSMMFNPGRDYDRENRLQADGPNYNDSLPGPQARQKLRLAAAFLATYLGAPSIYYGTEVGMFGADDPNNRSPMWWPDLMPYDNPDDRIDEDLLNYYRRLNAIRNTYGQFHTGNYETRLADDRKELLAFSRQGEAGSALVVLNNSTQEQTALVSVDGLRDEIGPVRTWIEVLRSGGAVFVNQRFGSSFRRGIRFPEPVRIRTRVDKSLEITLPAKSAAIYVSTSD